MPRSLKKVGAVMLAMLASSPAFAQQCQTQGCQYTLFNGHVSVPPRAAAPPTTATTPPTLDVGDGICQYGGTIPESGGQYTTYEMEGSPLEPVVIKTWVVVKDQYPAGDLHATCASAPLLGQRDGSATDAPTSGVTKAATFAAWLGRPSQFAVDGAWYDQNAATTERSLNTVATDWHNAGFTQMVTYLPLFTTSDGTTLAQAAAPSNATAYAAEFTNYAQTLINEGFSGAIIRLGWEFNGTWYTWSSGSDPTDFIALWQAAVTAMRAVPGAAFKFDWNPSLGAGNPEPSYPGDSYVDYIGGDVYDKYFHTISGCPQTPNFCNLENEPYGLNWQVSFAAAHNKFVSYPEWGIWLGTYGLGDDPSFVTSMAAWIAAHNTVYAGVWNEGAQELDIPTTQAPNSAAAYLSAY